MGQVPKGFNRNNYETPDWFFQSLCKEFRFSFDLCATKKSSKCKSFYGPIDDALSQDWFLLPGWLWINPPYSPLEPWIQKIQREAQLGAKIVALVPPVVCTNYFVEFLPSEIRFIVGRINFFAHGVEVVGNRQDSCLMIFDKQKPVTPKVSWVRRDDLMKGKK
jgi:phage N-6-adenine-methyltransferase